MPRLLETSLHAHTNLYLMLISCSYNPYLLYFFRKLAVTVREVVEAERERKIKEREEWKQIQDYHETILRKGTLDDIQLPKSATHNTKRGEAMSAGILFDPGNTHSQSRLHQVKNAPLSLCAPLGSASRVKIKEKNRKQGKKKRR